ncbi:MAG TPA: hypothetical protein ENN36_08005 [Candidatus Bathyarchaeota archaeon]|nr:hypothetical protein [Candidatus Bathyarchaeota archaeon]
MKELHSSWRDLANDCFHIMLVCGTIGIALKFTTFFNRWVYFPSFPNILDATFLIFSVLYLAWKARKAQIALPTSNQAQTKSAQPFLTRINAQIKKE